MKLAAWMNGAVVLFVEKVEQVDQLVEGPVSVWWKVQGGAASEPVGHQSYLIQCAPIHHGQLSV